MEIPNPHNTMTTCKTFRTSLIVQKITRSLVTAAINQGALQNPSNTDKKGFIRRAKLSTVRWAGRNTAPLGFCARKLSFNLCKTFYAALVNLLCYSELDLLKLFCTLIAALNKSFSWVRHRFLLMLCMGTHTKIYIHAPLHRCAHRNRFSSSPITKRILITCCLKSEACILHTSVCTNAHHLWKRAERNNSVSRDYFCPVIQPAQNNELSRGLKVTKDNEIQLQKQHDDHF